MLKAQNLVVSFCISQKPIVFLLVLHLINLFSLYSVLPTSAAVLKIFGGFYGFLENAVLQSTTLVLTFNSRKAKKLLIYFSSFPHGNVFVIKYIKSNSNIKNIFTIKARQKHTSNGRIFFFANAIVSGTQR